MYHYVRPDNKQYPNINSLDVDIFKRQLDYFEKEYGFLSKDEYQSSIREGNNLKGVVLTFDDGLKDHFNYVLPELEERGLWGVFYIPTGVYQSDKLLGVHRVHYLKGKYGSKLILNEAIKYIDDGMLDHNTINEFDKEIYTTSGYGDDEKQLRRLLNYYVSYDYRDNVLDKLMTRFFDEKELFKEVYLSVGEIQGLASAGNIIGAHTDTHKVLSRLPYQEQFDEIDSSFKFLDGIIKQDYKSFCYPYGYSGSYNDDTLKILSELNVDDACVFDNKIQNDKVKKYELSRIDCNQFSDV